MSQYYQISDQIINLTPTVTNYVSKLKKKHIIHVFPASANVQKFTMVGTESTLHINLFYFFCQWAIFTHLHINVRHKRCKQLSIKGNVQFPGNLPCWNMLWDGLTVQTRKVWFFSTRLIMQAGIEKASARDEAVLLFALILNFPSTWSTRGYYVYMHRDKTLWGKVTFHTMLERFRDQI